MMTDCPSEAFAIPGAEVGREVHYWAYPDVFSKDDHLMTDQPDKTGGRAPSPASRRKEMLTFLVLAFGIWPIVAVGVVGGYGFLIWMYQIVAGPPGPMGH